MENDPRLSTIRHRGGMRYKAFLDAGYQEWYSAGALLRNTPYLLQKAIRDEQGLRLFFIDIFVYDLTEYQLERDEKIGYQTEANFNTHSKDMPSFNVTMVDDITLTPESIEAFFKRIYVTMKCEPYGNN